MGIIILYNMISSALYLVTMSKSVLAENIRNGISQFESLCQKCRCTIPPMPLFIPFRLPNKSFPCIVICSQLSNAGVVDS